MVAFKKPTSAGSFEDVMKKALLSEEVDDSEKEPAKEPETTMKKEIEDTPKQVVETPKPKIPLTTGVKTVEEEQKPKVKAQINIPVSSVSEESIHRVITVYEAYNNLESSAQRTTVLYLNLSEKDSIEKIISKVLQVTKDDVDGLSNFVELKRTTPTDRAFALMSMNSNELLKLNEIVSTFNDSYEFQHVVGDDRERIEFCRRLDKGLTEIPNNSLDVLAPMMDLFKRGRP